VVKQPITHTPKQGETMSRDFQRTMLAVLGLCITTSALQVNASIASTKAKIIPPSQWFGTPKYSPDGTKVVVQSPAPQFVETIGPDGKVRRGQEDMPQGTVILNTKDNSLVSEMDCSLWATWSPDSKYVCGRSIDQKNWNFDFVIFDAASGLKIRAMKLEQPEQYAWSPDSKQLLITQRKSISIFDIDRKQERVLAISDDVMSLDHPQWSPDSKLVAVTYMIENAGIENCYVKIWNSATQSVTAEIKVNGMPRAAEWTPNGKLFIYSEPFLIKIMDAQTMKELSAIETLSMLTPYFLWSNDKKRLAYEDDGFIHVLDGETMKEILKIPVATNGNCRYEWSSDDLFFLVSTSDTAALCDARNGNYLGHKTWSDGYQINLSSDQKSVLIQKGNDNTVSEPIMVPPPAGTSAFENGKLGSPGWDKNATVKTIEECFEQFDKELSTANRKRFQEIPENGTGDFGGGSVILDNMMSNSYHQWNTTPLQKFFLSRGLTDSRNVTHIILVSYWRYLNNKPINLDEQIAQLKAYGDHAKSIIRYDQTAPAELISGRLKSKSGAVIKIGELKSKSKIVAFLDSDEIESVAQLKCLNELREKYPHGDAEFIVCIVAPKLRDHESWSESAPNQEKIGSASTRNQKSFEFACRNLEIVDANREILKSLINLARPSTFSKLSLPQTLVIDGSNILKMRVNRFEGKATAKALDTIISELAVHNSIYE
jgi:hypothetical protein